MKKMVGIVMLLLFSVSCVGNRNEDEGIKTGAEQPEKYLQQLQGKKVGLVVNHTSLVGEIHLVDFLRSRQVQVEKIFAPEHGFRGDAPAGAKIADEVDSKTGIPVVSLYGENRKPKPEHLEGLDLLIFDIQDVGCRSYTYISTMGLAMEAAAANDIEFVVLDRPNPLGGERVEGAIVEEGFISFVSQFKIPYIYGLTCGELAMMLNEEGMLSGKCKLHIVQMEGWRRDMLFEETGLQWVAPSPHIPNPMTALFYPASGLLGELYYISVGVGYTIPFEMFAAEWIDAGAFADRLNSYSIPGLYFRPLHIKPFYSVGTGKNLSGVQIHLLDKKRAPLSEVQFYVMQAIAELYPNKAVFNNADPRRFRMFDQVGGSDKIRLNFSQRNRFEDIKKYWYKDAESFKKLSAKYYLYR